MKTSRPLLSIRIALTLGLGLALCALSGAAWAKRVATGQPALVQAIDRALNDPGLGDARIGLFALRADGQGKPLLSYQADVPLHPASNAKVVTTAAALSLLGPNFGFRTDVYATDLKGGQAQDLYVVGRGDPRLFSEGLLALLEEARFKGLKSVAGDVIVDDSWYAGGDLPPGFEEKPADDAAYRAPSGALNLNFNAIAVHLSPGASVGAPPVVKVWPPQKYVTVQNSATTTARGPERLSVLSTRDGQGRTVLKVGGTIGLKHREVVVRRRIDEPALFTGYAARQLLTQLGVKVKGEVRVGRLPGKGAQLLARRYSEDVTRLSADVNKWSNNMMAESLLRAMARQGGDGSWAQGRAAVTQFLTEEVGLKGFRYHNGSGLFGPTEFSPRQLVQVLTHMHTRRPALPEFEASMAIGGQDGTLRRRFKGAARGQVRAKTGTLNGVSTLSGYVYRADGALVAFSVLLNGDRLPAGKARALQDAVVQALME